MRKPEQQFWDLLKDHLPGDVCRVENLADSGTPDVNGCFDGHEYWIELKAYPDQEFSTDTRRDITKHLRPAQMVWHVRRRHAKGKVLVLIRFKHHICAYKPLAGFALEGSVVVYSLLFVSEKSANKFDWPKIKDLLEFAILN